MGVRSYCQNAPAILVVMQLLFPFLLLFLSNIVF
jgi:hypothetical protein